MVGEKLNYSISALRVNIPIVEYVYLGHPVLYFLICVEMVITA